MEAVSGIDYTLAAELRDAGFPQRGAGKMLSAPIEVRPHNINDDYVVPYQETLKRYAYLPTLEELIEACGFQLEAITQQQSHAGSEWVAIPFYGNKKSGKGTTPTEAVARLYLALNKKSLAQTPTPNDTK